MSFNRDEIEDELLKDYDDKPTLAARLKFVVPSVVLLLIFFGFAFWYYKQHFYQADETIAGVPFVRADTLPLRHKPKDPGGLQVKNKDKIIYQSLSEQKKLPKVTRILSSPEEPLDRKRIGPKTHDLDPVRVKESVRPEATQAPSVAKEGVKPSPPIKRIEAVKPAVEKDLLRIQLGAYRNEGDVVAMWNRLEKDFTNLLEGKYLHQETVDLGKKGIFYRLQIGGYPDVVTARKACQAFIKRKQGCFVVQ